MTDTSVKVPELSESPQMEFWDYQEFNVNVNQLWGRRNKKKKETKVPCERPCIRVVFKPLGVYAKIFGLFPTYDLEFVEKLDASKVKCVHVLDYMYSTFVALIMASGAALCFFRTPKILEKMKSGSEDTDYLVISAIFYMTIAMGVSALFIFPKSHFMMISYLNHFEHIDKILCFDGRFARAEKRFARRLFIYLTTILIFALCSWFSLCILDVSSENPDYVDYLMVFIVSLAVMAHVIPTVLFVFFVNSIRIRLLQFNDKVKGILSPITPSCFACKNFQDYGKEIDERLEKKEDELSFTLEKMRILHGELSQLVFETSDLFGGHLIRDFIYSLCGCILYSYFLMFLQDQGQGEFWFIYIILDIFVAAKIITICCFGDCIKVEALSLLKLLNKASTLRISPDCITQIQMFIKKLDAPFEITASGFFTIDKRLLTGIIGSITTYFVILVQFKQQDMSREFEILKQCNFTTETLLDVMSNKPV